MMGQLKWFLLKFCCSETQFSRWVSNGDWLSLCQFSSSGNSRISSSLGCGFETLARSRLVWSMDAFKGFLTVSLAKESQEIGNWFIWFSWDCPTRQSDGPEWMKSRRIRCFMVSFVKRTWIWMQRTNFAEDLKIQYMFLTRMNSEKESVLLPMLEWQGQKGQLERSLQSFGNSVWMGVCCGASRHWKNWDCSHLSPSILLRL